MSVEGDTIVASGQAQIDPAIKASVAYRALAGGPVVAMTLTLENTGTADFHGYFQYLLDPDSAEDVSIVPGVAGNNAGFVTSGWTGNFIYDGPTRAIYSPAHAIAWQSDEPSGVTAFGYIAGAWFAADVPAGGTRNITWYHITDYPAVGSDVTANIAAWATQLETLGN